MSRATRRERPYVESSLFAGHYLDESVPERDEWDCDDAAREAMADLRRLYGLVDGPGGGGDAPTGDRVEEVLDVLGFETREGVALPDGNGVVDLLFEARAEPAGSAEAPVAGGGDDPFERSFGVLKVESDDADATEGVGGGRRHTEPPDRVDRHLDETPASVRWAVVTDGRTWRLYEATDDEPRRRYDAGSAETSLFHRASGAGDRPYYEVDLPPLLERDDPEAFKYFYVFFRPAAFRASDETAFLDRAHTGSETAVRELGEAHRENVARALDVLGRGFVETNDGFEVSPGDEETLEELRDESLIVLYRILAVLFAEARGFGQSEPREALDVDQPERRTTPDVDQPERRETRAEYEANDGLDARRRTILDEIGDVPAGFEEAFSERSTKMWRRLSKSFRLFDDGRPEFDLPPFPGNLFDDDEHPFPSDHAVSDRHLAEVVYRLSTAPTDEGRYVPVAFADLDARHLGSIHERALERRFRVATEPLAAVAENGGRIWRPAGTVADGEAVATVPEGSLHATDDDGERKATGAYYTPDHVVSYVVEETVGPLVEETREDLLDEGFEPGNSEYVDALLERVTDLRILDPAMGSGRFLRAATDYLAERVMAAARGVGADHGKAGDTGADPDAAVDPREVRRQVVDECIYGVDLDGMAVELATLSLWLATLGADRPPAGLGQHLARGNALVGAGADAAAELAPHSADGDDSGELRRRLTAAANVHTAEGFGLAVPDAADGLMRRALAGGEAWTDVTEREWFRAAQAMAEERSFFHWPLAFPEAFYRADGTPRDDAGFDAVIGNPPWVATAGRGEISASMDATRRAYLESAFATAERQFDRYVAFAEQFVRLARTGRTGIVVPDAVLTREQNQPIRGFLLRETQLRSVVDVGTAFPGIETGAAVLVTGGDGSAVRCADASGRRSLDDLEYTRIPQAAFADRDHDRFLIHLDEETRSVLSTIEAHPPLGTRIDISRGEEMGKRADVLRDAGDETTRPIVPGGAVERYGFDSAEVRHVPKHRIEKAPANYRSPKLVFRQTSDALVGALDEADRVTIKSAYNVHVDSDDNRDHKCVLGILNSTLLNAYHHLKHAAYRSVFPQINQSTFESLPVPADVPPPVRSELADLVDRRRDLTERFGATSTELFDYVDHGPDPDPDRDGPTLAAVGTCRVPDRADDSMLAATAADHPNLRIGSVACERDHEDAVLVRATARYKPDDEVAHETDRWGYAETDPVPAMRLTDLSVTEADLVAAFVPVAVERADGFAGFRERTTKTNSLLDRLAAITLPDPDGVADGLRRYREAVERAAALDAEIRRTEDRIDELVYDLYGLTDGEIEALEKAMNEN
ncbi:MAG: TaqI-like C-terminal specificity domain-containing protein [Halobacteriales archaeon]